MKVDKQKFDSLLGKMLQMPAQKRSETKPEKKAKLKRPKKR